MLANWKWGLFHQQNTVWNKVLRSRCGGWRGLFEGEMHQKTSIWWRELRRVCGEESIDHWFGRLRVWILG